MAGKKRTGPFVVAFGGEDYFLDRAVELGRSRKDREVVVLDGDGMTDHDFVDICEMRAFDGTDRVVVLDNANKLKGDKVLKPYIEAKDPQDDSVIIIAVVRSDKLSDLWKAAAAKGRSDSYPKLKPWEGAKLQKHVEKEAERLKLTLGKGTVAAFTYFLGAELRPIVNELRKLIYVVGEGGVVERKHVAMVVAPAMPAQPWEVADAAAEKNAKKAMNLVSLLYKSKGDGVCIPITAALLKTVEKLIVARQMLDKGDGKEILAARFDMHPFRVEKYLIPLAQKHTVPRLRVQMKHLCKLDAQIKGPAQSKRTLVELAVLSIAA